MLSSRVVPNFYPGKDSQPYFCLGLSGAPSYQLKLQAGKEALGHSVVIRVTHGSHGWAYAHFLAAVAKGNASVLGVGFVAGGKGFTDLRRLSRIGLLALARRALAPIVKATGGDFEGLAHGAQR